MSLLGSNPEIIDGDSLGEPTVVTRRLRIAHVLVQPVLVWDDGTELAPGPQAAAVPIPLSELAVHAERLRTELVRVQAEESPPTRT